VSRKSERARALPAENVSPTAQLVLRERARRARRVLAQMLVVEHGVDVSLGVVDTDELAACARDFAQLTDMLGLSPEARGPVYGRGRCIQCARPLSANVVAPSAYSRYSTPSGLVCSIRCKTAYYRGEEPAERDVEHERAVRE